MSTSRKFSGSFSIALRTRVPLSFWSANGDLQSRAVFRERKGNGDHRKGEDQAQD
jgi:hypothetical protein